MFLNRENPASNCPGSPYITHVRNSWTENQRLHLRAPALEFLLNVLIHQARWNHRTETLFLAGGRDEMESENCQEILGVVPAGDRRG